MRPDLIPTNRGYRCSPLRAHGASVPVDAANGLFRKFRDRPRISRASFVVTQGQIAAESGQAQESRFTGESLISQERGDLDAATVLLNNADSTSKVTSYYYLLQTELPYIEENCALPIVIGRYFRC